MYISMDTPNHIGTHDTQINAHISINQCYLQLGEICYNPHGLLTYCTCHHYHQYFLPLPHILCMNLLFLDMQHLDV